MHTPLFYFLILKICPSLFSITSQKSKVNSLLDLYFIDVITDVDNNSRNDRKAIKKRNKNIQILFEKHLSAKIMGKRRKIHYVEKHTIQKEFNYIYLRGLNKSVIINV